MTDNYEKVEEPSKRLNDSSMFRSPSMDRSLLLRKKYQNKDMTLLDQVADAYNTHTQEMNSFITSHGEEPLNMDCTSNPTEVLIGNKNEIQLFDWTQYGEKTVHLLQNQSEDNRFSFLKMSDARIVIADKEQIEVIDMQNETTLASLSSSDLGNTEKSEYISIELVDDEKFLILLTKNQITKVDLSKRDQITIVCKWANGRQNAAINEDELQEEKPLWHMQIFEDLNRVYVSQTNDDPNFTDIFELKLTDLSLNRTIGPEQGFFQVGSFFYSPLNGTLFCKEQKGTVMRIWDVKKNLTEFVKETIIDGADTSSGKQAFQEYLEDNIVFQGGADMVIAIDLADKNSIAKFKLKGDVFSMKITKDRAYLLVASNDKIDENRSTNQFYKISLKKHDFANLQIEGGITSMTQHKSNSDFLYVVHGSSLKMYNVASNKMNNDVIAEVGTQSDEPRSLDTNEKYCFQLGNQENGNDILQRLDLTTGEVQVVTDGLSNLKNLSIHAMQVISPSHYPAGICTVSTGEYGVHMIDCETLENIYTQKVDDDGDYLKQTVYMQSENIIFTGSQRGILSISDISDIEKLKNQEQGVTTQFATLDSGVSSMEISPLPIEFYLAIGTEKGAIHIYKKKYIKLRKPYKYMEMTVHKTPIRGFSFIKAGDDYLLASFSETGNIVVLCVKERLNIYRNDNIPNGVQNMVYNDRVNALFMITRREHEFYQISLDFNNEFFQNYTDEINSDLAENIKRRFLRQNNEDVQETMIKHIAANDVLAFQKINLFSIAAILGRSQALKVAAPHFNMLRQVDGDTLIQICGKSNDTDCIDVCLEKLADGQGTLNWQTLCQIIQSQETDHVREVLTQCQIIEPEYNEQATDMLPFKGIIKKRYYESENRVINPDMIGDMVDINVTLDQQKKIVITKLCTKISMNLGSQNCINILEELDKGQDSNLQHPQTSMYVQALWESNIKIVLAYSFINFQQFVLLALTVIIDPFNETMMGVCALYSLIMLLLECRQVAKQGSKYFSDPFNYLDNIGNLFVIIMYINLVRLKEDTYHSQVRKLLLIIGLLSLGLRALSQLRMFSKFRALIHLITQTIEDMFYFGSVIFIIIFLISVVNSVDNIEPCNASHHHYHHVEKIVTYLGSFYQLVLGVNPDGNQMTGLQWVIYLLFTVLVNVTSMNLLIAILSNTYDKVMSTLDAVHFRTKVSILNEVQDFMFWNRKNNEMTWLYFVIYNFENLNPNHKGDDEWEGRVKMMQNYLTQVKGTCKTIQDENQFALKKQDDTQHHVELVLHQQNEIKHHFEGEIIQMKKQLGSMEEFQKEFMSAQENKLDQIVKMVQNLKK